MSACQIQGELTINGVGAPISSAALHGQTDALAELSIGLDLLKNKPALLHDQNPPCATSEKHGGLLCGYQIGAGNP